MAHTEIETLSQFEAISAFVFGAYLLAHSPGTWRSSNDTLVLPACVRVLVKLYLAHTWRISLRQQECFLERMWFFVFGAYF